MLISVAGERDTIDNGKNGFSVLHAAARVRLTIQLGESRAFERQVIHEAL